MGKYSKTIFKIVMSGALIAIGWVLPFLTGQIKEIGAMLSPMHLPVFFGGFLVGPIYALVIGIVLPITRSLIFGMPVLFPSAVCMGVEMGVYGFITGFLFKCFVNAFKKEDNTITNGKLFISIYVALVSAMLLGRAVWGLARMLCAFLPDAKAFPMTAFISGAFINAWPGIILQLILIPAIVFAMRKYILKQVINNKDDEDDTEEVDEKVVNNEVQEG